MDTIGGPYSTALSSVPYKTDVGECGVQYLEVS
jgi:hypothetical protein